MALSVNLLKKSSALSEKQYLREKRILQASIWTFVFVFFITIFVFGWVSVTSVQVTNIEDKIVKAERDLAGLQSASSMQLFIKSRLQLVTNFLNSRTKTREAIQRIFSLPLNGVTVSSAIFEDETHLKIQLSASSVTAFDEAYSYFENSKEFFVEVVNLGVVRTDSGLYTLSLILTLPKGMDV